METMTPLTTTILNVLLVIWCGISAGGLAAIIQSIIDNHKRSKREDEEHAIRMERDKEYYERAARTK